MFASENLKEVYEQKYKRGQAGVECVALVCGTESVDRNRARIRISRAGIAMTTSHPILTVTPQFDGGRWKLRLAYAPLEIAKQIRASVPFESTLASIKTGLRWIDVKNENEATQ